MEREDIWSSAEDEIGGTQPSPREPRLLRRIRIFSFPNPIFFGAPLVNSPRKPLKVQNL